MYYPSWILSSIEALYNSEQANSFAIPREISGKKYRMKPIIHTELSICKFEQFLRKIVRITLFLNRHLIDSIFLQNSF